MKLDDRKVEPILEKLRDVESFLLAIITDGELRECWRAADDAKVHVWRAIQRISDLARED